MSIRNPTDLPGILRPGERLLGLDVGEKTIGLAVSDPSLRVASPIGTIRRGKRFRDDAATLLAAVDERKAGALVIGLPVNMDGSEGPRCQSVRQFAANLLGLRELEIAFWDERMSTIAVTRAMIDADMSRAKRARTVDTAAAAYILQGLLDRLAWADRSRC